MLRSAMAAAGLVLGLSACAPMGVDSREALRDEFEAPVSYQDAYQRARSQAEQCLRGESGHEVDGGVDTAGRTGQVYVRAPFTQSRLASVDIRAVGQDRSQVSIAMWGVNIWDQKAVAAMRDAILIGVPSCRSYMPVGGDKHGRR